MIGSNAWFRATAVALVLVPSVPVQAGEWQHELAPYVWASGMSGATGVGDVVADVDMSFGDIVDQLEMGFMGTYRASRDRYSIIFDGIYMGLGATERGPGGRLKADVDLDQTALELDGGYEVVDRLTLLAGLRYVNLSVDATTTGPLDQARHASMDENWFDPVIGAIYKVPFADAWSFMVRGDVGGFGVGSDFSWQGMAAVRWQATPSFGVAAAYRHIDIDYESGHGDHAFKYDMAISGPALGVVFTF
jgi:outer membrane receptor protein involved in Fe transport